MPSIRDLYDLQQLDWDIQKLEEELTDIRARVADDSRRLTAKRQLDALETRLADLARPRRQTENNIEDIELRIAEIDGRLYDGSVTNPRELEAYQEERTNMSGSRSDEEDKLLELMIETDDTQALLDKAREIFERIDGERERELESLKARHAEVSSELPDFKERRGELVSEQAPMTLAIYEQVRKLRGGQGAALVDRRGLCQGCRLVIPTTELQRVRAGDQVVQCGSCSRILIYE
ncbi:MAG: C4-type zinc ribbon domain-containing protein [Dehalococcoidia bacterium]|nr:C4-type zinc ribbon domain-containing protein [Dehalococcoidia bacterium]